MANKNSDPKNVSKEDMDIFRKALDMLIPDVLKKSNCAGCIWRIFFRGNHSKNAQ